MLLSGFFGTPGRPAGSERSRSATGDAERLRRFRTNAALLVAVAIGMVVAYIHQGVITATLAVFGAALALGSLLGFLFGIPGFSGRRVSINRPGAVAFNTGGAAVAENKPVMEHDFVSAGNAAAPPTEPEPTEPGPDQHTEPSNLEQVSDWVTKLLLGGGLTQIQQIPPKIWEWSGAAAVGINPAASGAAFRRAGVCRRYDVVRLRAGIFWRLHLITKLQLGRSFQSLRSARSAASVDTIRESLWNFR